MELKKSEKADLNRLRVLFFEIGMIVSLSFVLYAFSYKEYDKRESNLGPMVYEEEMEVMENTVQKQTPPPPPPPPELEIVEDDVKIEEKQPEIKTTDTKQDEVIKPKIVVPKNEIETTDDIFEFHEVSEMAAFKGGDKEMYKFIGENLSYPPMAFENEIEGKVIVQFVVMPDGSLKDIEILGSKKLGWGCEESAIAVIKKMSGMWNPAKQRDKKVPVRFRLPIKFEISG
jgi:protein TonB